MARVLYVSANAVAGGAERATMLMLAAHNRQRYQPGVLFFADGPLVGEARALGIDVRVARRPMRLSRPATVVRMASETAGILRVGGYDLLHSCMSYPHLAAGPAATLAGVPAVLYQHGPVGSWMDGAATAVRCDHILTNSAFTAGEQLRRSWRRRPTTVVPCAVEIALDDHEACRERPSVNAEFGLTPDISVVAIVSRFDPLKGIDVAIQAMAPLLRAREDLRLMIVGGQYKHFYPGYGDRLRALVAREQVTERVIFAGVRADVRRLYARLDLLLQCSVQPESFGLTIVEAMACGVPVIGPRFGGPAEIIEDEVDGLLHAPGDVAGLREAVTRLLDDTALRSQCIANGRRKVEARYRPAPMIAAIEQVYDHVLGGRS